MPAPTAGMQQWRPGGTGDLSLRETAGRIVRPAAMLWLFRGNATTSYAGGKKDL